jgi:phosphotransferase system HPr (HPr) family protein
MKQKMTIVNNAKLFMKFLSELQQAAVAFKSHIIIQKGEALADAKSFIEILGLIDAKGDKIEVTAEGEDAPQALEAIRQLAAANYLKLNHEPPLHAAGHRNATGIKNEGE